MSRLNERLSYLRYGAGNYFRGHCDGQLELPDGRKSRVTVQVYLGNDDVEGGATRFWDQKQKNWYDVDPKKGRVLIFQQRGLWHSGEDVIKGTKFTLRSDLLFRQCFDEAE
jgi:Rps23 Pro-64 3,4-dihydroxylase Tpa1-like proline 4-hydroxylase